MLDRDFLIAGFSGVRFSSPKQRQREMSWGLNFSREAKKCPAAYI